MKFDIDVSSQLKKYWKFRGVLKIFIIIFYNGKPERARNFNNITIFPNNIAHFKRNTHQ